MFWIFIILTYLIIASVYSFIQYKKAVSLQKTVIDPCYHHSYGNSRFTNKTQQECIADTEEKTHCQLVKTDLKMRNMDAVWIPFCILFVFWLIVSVPITAVQINESNNVSNSTFYVQELTAQRNALLAEFDDVLDNQDFVQLMNAAVPEDVKFLKNDPKVTDFLLGRADRIVEVNTTLFAARNKILEQSKSVCNYVQNPMIPMVPFMVPDCDLNIVLEVLNTEY